MSSHTAAADSIRRIIQARWPDRFSPEQLTDEVPLDATGLGLDSVDIVEVVFECEQLYDRRAGEEIYAPPPLTVSRLARHFDQSGG